MQKLKLTPIQLINSFLLHRRLIVALIWRDVAGRYRGSMMGVLWSFLNPLLMLATYTFVFSVVFKARWGLANESNIDFAVVLFVGMIIYTIFSECVNRAPTLIVNNTNYVKKVVFPLDILPWVTLGSAIFHAAISLTIWIAFYLLVNSSLHFTALLLPLILLPLFMFIMGVSWFLAALGVYLRDVGQAVGIITTLLLFTSPVFFPVASLPEEYQSFIYANPLTFFIEQTRNVLIWGILPDWPMLAFYTLGSAIIGWIGFVWFQKTRNGFADIL